VCSIRACPPRRAGTKAACLRRRAARRRVSAVRVHRLCRRGSIVGGAGRRQRTAAALPRYPVSPEACNGCDLGRPSVARLPLRKRAREGGQRGGGQSPHRCGRATAPQPDGGLEAPCASGAWAGPAAPRAAQSGQLPCASVSGSASRRRSRSLQHRIQHAHAEARSEASAASEGRASSRSRAACGVVLGARGPGAGDTRRACP